MPRSAPAAIRLTAEEEAVLRGWTRKAAGEHRLAERAQIILLSHEGESVEKIAARMHTRPARVSKWRQRFSKFRLNALSDAPRSGKPQKYGADVEQQVLALLDQKPPRGYSQWNGRLLAEALGGVSADQVWRILRKRDMQLQRRRRWYISTDPEFGSKAADVVGLYLNPPQDALVLCIDEKPHIQALERAQGFLRLPNGKAVNGFSQCYQRHRTTTLLAALNVVRGEVQTGHYPRRRRPSFFISSTRSWRRIRGGKCT
jgi:transposase